MTNTDTQGRALTAEDLAAMRPQPYPLLAVDPADELGLYPLAVIGWAATGDIVSPVVLRTEGTSTPRVRYGAMRYLVGGAR